MSGTTGIKSSRVVSHTSGKNLTEVLDVRRLPGCYDDETTIVLSTVKNIKDGRNWYNAKWNELTVTSSTIFGGWKTYKATFHPFHVHKGYSHWHVLLGIKEVREQDGLLSVTFETNGAEAITPTATLEFKTGIWTFEAQRPMYGGNW